MNRFTYTLKKAFSHQSELHALLKDRSLSCKSVLEITPELLNKKNIGALVLDFDGVLSPHAAEVPLSPIISWLHHLQHHWPYPIFIFSNNPSITREIFFKEHFPSVKFIKNMPRKPYPDGLLYVQKKTGLEAQHILMVDDRLLTGMLAGILAGTQGLWVKKPVQNFKHHFFREMLFAMFRKMDKAILHAFKCMKS